MMDKINETSHLRRDLTELSRKLSPDSAFHRSASASELKSVSENIVPLKERVDKVFGNAPAREIEDYTFAYKGLLQEAKPRRQLQPEKPSLNVEDLDYM
ncbi:hypothetical protein FRC02_003250 [Tulasnella sp. 418]|nr:hypothetical protein FRC02_003250 [Tulasnella sp. 418]